MKPLKAVFHVARTLQRRCTPLAPPPVDESNMVNYWQDGQINIGLLPRPVTAEMRAQWCARISFRLTRRVTRQMTATIVLKLRVAVLALLLLLCARAHSSCFAEHTRAASIRYAIDVNRPR